MLSYFYYEMIFENDNESILTWTITWTINGLGHKKDNLRENFDA